VASTAELAPPVCSDQAELDEFSKGGLGGGRSDHAALLGKRGHQVVGGLGPVGAKQLEDPRGGWAQLGRGVRRAW
jgi:hypothetical protein